MPRVSILIPLRNDGPRVETALRSVRRQTLGDWECVVVDDGSTDDGPEKVAAFAARDPRIRLLRRPAAGIVAALEAGVGACRAPLVARLDADDWMHRDRLAEQVALLDARPALDAVGCGVRVFPREGLGPGRLAYEAWLNGLDSAEKIRRDRFVECPVAHPSLMIRRERLVALGYRERPWPEDYDLVLRLLRDGPVVGTVPRRLVAWRDHPERLSRIDPRCRVEAFTACRAWFLHRDFLRDRPRYVLWGYGATGRNLARALAVHGHEPAAIVEVHPGRLGQRIAGAPVVPVEALDAGTRHPIVVSVAGAEARSEIRRALDRRAFVEGRDYVCAA